VWSRWGAGPIELLLVLAPAAWYALGVRALWRRGGAGRGVARRRVAAFAAGVLALLVALASPLDALAEALFSAHMVQHLVLILVAAPLCVAGAPLLPALWALPPAARRRVGRWWRAHGAARAVGRALGAPGLVLALHTVALWFWHFPAPYQAALGSRPLHALEHASFFGTALLFWWIVLQPVGRRRASHGAALLLVGATLMQSGALGAVLLYARTPWYPAHGAGARAWGVTLLADQQLAGILMWVPAGFVYVAAAAWLMLRWLAADARGPHGARVAGPAAARAIALPPMEGLS
jgi:putative membrane protein